MWLYRLWVVVQSCVVWKMLCNLKFKKALCVFVFCFFCYCSVKYSSRVSVSTFKCCSSYSIIRDSHCFYIVTALSLLVVANFSHPVYARETGTHEQTERPLAESPLLFNMCVCVFVCVYMPACPWAKVSFSPVRHDRSQKHHWNTPKIVTWWFLDV